MRQNQKLGFTLIELLVATMLFLAAVAGFHYLLKSGASTVSSANRLQQAALAIQQQMEELRAAPFSQLVQYHNRSFARGQGKISALPVMTDLVKIDLELVWDKEKTPLKLSTLRSPY